MKTVGLNSMSPANLKGVITWLPLLLVAGSGLLAWGQTTQKVTSTSTRVSALEERIEQTSQDRERIVRIETQVETLTTTLGEVRTEQKELEQLVRDNFDTLLEELRRNR